MWRSDRRTHYPARMTLRQSELALFAILPLCLAGCAYDRSFMQMDSNSGAPFFGLQWSVDSGSRPGRAGHSIQLEGARQPDVALRTSDLVVVTARQR